MEPSSFPRGRGASGAGRTAVLGLLLATACSTPPPPQVRFASQESTRDGLYRLRNDRFSAAFAKPGAHLADYVGLLIGSSTVAFQTEPATLPGGDGPREGADEQTLSELRRILRQSIERELSREFPIADDRGAGVLWATAHILGLSVDIRAPRGGERAWGGDLGEITLVLDVRDSDTGDALVRLVDRRKLSFQYQNSAEQRTAGAAWDAVRTAIADWAFTARRELALLRDAGIPPLPR